MKPSQNTLLDQMDRLGGVPITVRAELDQTTLTFADLLGLEAGNIIKLSRSTGENIDVCVENVLIGWGEVLLVDGTLTVRMADLRNAHAPSLLESEDESQPGAAQEKQAHGGT